MVVTSATSWANNAPFDDGYAGTMRSPGTRGAGWSPVARGSDGTKRKSKPRLTTSTTVARDRDRGRHRGVHLSSTPVATDSSTESTPSTPTYCALSRSSLAPSKSIHRRCANGRAAILAGFTYGVSFGPTTARASRWIWIAECSSAVSLQVRSATSIRCAQPRETYAAGTA